MVAVTRVKVFDDDKEIKVKFLDSEQYRRRKENVNAEANSHPWKINPLTFKKPLHEKALQATLVSQWKKQQN